MKLYFHQFEGGVENFGDDLNRWLWPQLLPDVLDDDPRVAFVGIGTLLNDALLSATPEARRRIIFSSGVGYGQGPLPLGADDRVYCVRGPLSARALSLPESAAVADGALLVRRLVRPMEEKCCPVAFMPHIEMIADRAWQAVCADLGIGYIDPRWPTERVLSGINSTEVLLTEAMHGAIVADALRVPWAAVSTRPGILPFKWQDWCASLDLEYAPHHLPSLFNPRRERDLLTPVRAARDTLRHHAALHGMIRILRDPRPTLSRDADLERATVRLEERLDALRADARAGDFALYRPRAAAPGGLRVAAR